MSCARPRAVPTRTRADQPPRRPLSPAPPPAAPSPPTAAVSHPSFMGVYHNCSPPPGNRLSSVRSALPPRERGHRGRAHLVASDGRAAGCPQSTTPRWLSRITCLSQLGLQTPFFLTRPPILRVLVTQQGQDHQGRVGVPAVHPSPASRLSCTRWALSIRQSDRSQRQKAPVQMQETKVGGRDGHEMTSLGPPPYPS